MSAGTSTAGDSSESGIFTAFGSVLGYIGGEAATLSTFERLLWPQRYYAGFDISMAAKFALLMPMGGPLYKAALQSLDGCFSHGIFRAPNRGHMLGSPFFKDDGHSYRILNLAGTQKSDARDARNCLWLRVLGLLPTPSMPPKERSKQDQAERAAKSAYLQKSTSRASVPACHLTLDYASSADKVSAIPMVTEQSGLPGFQCFIGVIATEFTGIVVAILVAVWQRSAWALFWMIPLGLKLLSTVLCLRREGFVPLHPIDCTTGTQSDKCDYEIQFAGPQTRLALISGPSNIVLQFFRHYGHPTRNYFYELSQAVIIVLFGCLFPVGLLVSILWMPIVIQYIWLSYQLYTMLVMYVLRYSEGDFWGSVEEKLAAELSKGENTVLLGSSRFDRGTVKATLDVVFYDRVLHAKDHMERIQQHRNHHKAQPVQTT